MAHFFLKPKLSFMMKQGNRKNEYRNIMILLYLTNEFFCLNCLTSKKKNTVIARQSICLHSPVCYRTDDITNKNWILHSRALYDLKHQTKISKIYWYKRTVIQRYVYLCLSWNLGLIFSQAIRSNFIIIVFKNYVYMVAMFFFSFPFFLESLCTGF